mgnify:CR=1 FL=1
MACRAHSGVAGLAFDEIDRAPEEGHFAEVIVVVVDASVTTPEELAAYTREQVESWKKAVADSGLPQD